MKRLIALLITILALIAGAGRAEVKVTSNCTPVATEITEEQATAPEMPAEAAVCPALPLKGDAVTNTDHCETEPETTDCAPILETVTETVTGSTDTPTEEKEIPVILSSADDPAEEPVTETVPGDGGDRMTSETDIEKSEDPAVTDSKETPEAVTEPEPTVISDVISDQVIVADKPTVETFPAAETDAEQGDTNAPVFIDPCQGGTNPFDDGTPTEIDDHSSDEFIGDGERPGEGIHF